MKREKVNIAITDGKLVDKLVEIYGCDNDVVLATIYLNKALKTMARGIDFELGFSEFKSLRSKTKCAYTGVYLGPDNFSIDRLDSSKGYTKDNCYACDSEFNQIKERIERENNSMHIDDILLGFSIVRKKLESKK